MDSLGQWIQVKSDLPLGVLLRPEVRWEEEEELTVVSPLQAKMTEEKDQHFPPSFASPFSVFVFLELLEKHQVLNLHNPEAFSISKEKTTEMNLLVFYQCFYVIALSLTLQVNKYC